MADPDPPESPGVPLTRRALREREAQSRASTEARSPDVQAPLRRPRAPAAAPGEHAPALGVVTAPSPAHARRRRAGRIGAAFAAVAVAVLVVGTAAAVIAAVTAPPLSEAASLEAEGETLDVSVEGSFDEPLPPVTDALPSPVVAPEVSGDDICGSEELLAALDARDTAAAIAAAGGAERFRSAVAAGTAPCVSLDDPSFEWVVVNKARPLDPIDYRPEALVAPDGVRNIPGTAMRPAVSTALSAMVTDAAAAGVGEIALLSGFRSYGTQVDTYASHVASRGEDGADTISARPGHSEHQAGLAADVVACDAGGCGGLDDLAGTPQGDWVAAHAWEYGFVVRYEDGFTDVTGYSPEPWHLRYVGADLARHYTEGGWHTLESFFGLPAAPDYDG
ncbi:M15 family metallopeptidase [Microbacterium aquimaris]|uniref:M15 family metallopeptidase n=1 Tax=Microbacterium aquimaris TaxID=459816 RepID=A0ABU5N361_9MICO|nr:M15 family metallopeptidase [Microbacterium aquimaris]MDZ8160526.1 M15 family metallopeptidase [Microbacterium aquimaris]